MDKIDFVMLWVDDNDPNWQEQYKKYSGELYGNSVSPRFRDWGTLKYWFRGVEKFTPWVNKVFFITCGHYPLWLNLKHPKLRFVEHKEYIPMQYLPTFNSHTIELNLHRINDLSEKFVYFNDDTFILDNLKPERFFQDGVPCDMGVLNAIQPHFDKITYILANNVSFINKYVDKKTSLKYHIAKWLNYKYGVNILRTIFLSRYERFTGFVDPHLPNAYDKNTLVQVWNTKDGVLDTTCRCKFRRYDNVNQYIFRYWQIVNGAYNPINLFADSYSFSEMSDDVLVKAINIIEKREKSLLCINDGDITDFQRAKSKLINAFEKILPEKSSFEL